MNSIESGTDYRDTILWDSARPLAERVKWLLANLTLEEKLHFLATRQPALPRLGIGAFSFGGEAAHGIEARHDQDGRGIPEETTSFPQPIGLSSSWDEELVERAGEIVGEEARVLFERNRVGGLCRWAPTVDMERDPRWGRTEEGYGEDPLLTGKMASAYIRGMQGRDGEHLRMAAAVKHFYANNVEDGRCYKSSSVDPRNKYEYYLEPFRRAVEEGGVEAMMTAYNEINGIPAILNHEVQDLVKDQWGLKGHVVCDGGDMLQTVDFHHYYGTHAETVAEALRAGVDCFTDNAEEVYRAAKEAYELGLVGEDEIDLALSHTFGTRVRLGLFDAVPRNPYADPNSQEPDGHNRITFDEMCRKELDFPGDGGWISRTLAEESAVLLKNQGDLLPLSGEEAYAAVGFVGNEWFKDWYGGIPPYRVTALCGIKRRLGKEIPFADGLPVVRLRCSAGFVGKGADGRLRLVRQEDALFLSLNDWGEGNVIFQDRATGKYVSFHEDGNFFAADKDEAFGWFVKERFYLENTEKGVRLAAWNERPVLVSADGLLYAQETVPVKEGLAATGIAAKEDTSPEFTLDLVVDGTGEAVKLAEKADKVIFFAGCNPMLCAKEEIDRPGLALPPMQEALLKAVYAANPNLVLVLLTNYPYTIGWEQEHVPAILQMPTGSQELGNALARLLFGDAVPSGRLPLTWYKSEADLPDINDYDIIRGKRTYQYFDGEVLYPFGFGLSYTSFSYSEPSFEYAPGKPSILVEVDVENTGQRAADLVVPIYAKRAAASPVQHPLRRLAGFGRVRDLKPGEVRHVVIEASVSALAVYDVAGGCMMVEKGLYQFSIGHDSCLDESWGTVIPMSGGQRGTRSMKHLTMADHFDDCENIRLGRTETVGNCAAAADPQRKAKLLYRGFAWEGGIGTFTVNLRCQGKGTLMVRLSGQEAARWEGSGVGHFENIPLPLRKLPEPGEAGGPGEGEGVLDGLGCGKAAQGTLECEKEALADLELEWDGDLEIARFRLE